jgi:SAM-dependent methyltransferase
VRSDLAERLPLICPGCARVGARGAEVFTLRLERAARVAGDEVLEGVLACVGCARRYPILDGLPLAVADLGGLLGRELAGLLDPDVDPQVASLLAAPGPDEAPLSRALEVLSIYLDSHWAEGPAPPLLARLGDRPRVARAIELGCGVGRGVAELARAADLTVGIDLGLGALRRARRLLLGLPLRYPRRVVGRHHVEALLEARAPAPGVHLVCGDAQSPPVLPASFDRVCALNLLDAVHDPSGQLQVAVALVAPGGELHLASPYAWQSGIVGEEHRLGGAEPAAEVRRRVEAAGLIVEVEEDVEWRLRRDARSRLVYDVHYLRARRPAATC